MARTQARAQAALVARLFGGAHLPFHARFWTFATFPADGDQEARRIVQAFVARHVAGDDTSQRGLYLGGATGRCKTSLAISALKTVMEAGHMGLFVMTLELMNRLRASFAKGADVREDDLLSAVTSVEWLVLDDLAVERPTAYVLEQLYFIIEKRRSQGLYTIFTGNLSTTNLEAHWRPESVQPGAFHSGVRIAERLREYCLGCTVKGRNMRGI